MLTLHPFVLAEAEKEQQVAKITWTQNIEEKEAQKKISEIEGSTINGDFLFWDLVSYKLLWFAKLDLVLVLFV